MSTEEEFNKIVNVTIDVVNDRFQRDKGYLMDIANAILDLPSNFQDWLDSNERRPLDRKVKEVLTQWKDKLDTYRDLRGQLVQRLHEKNQNATYNSLIIKLKEIGTAHLQLQSPILRHLTNQIKMDSYISPSM